MVGTSAWRLPADGCGGFADREFGSWVYLGNQRLNSYQIISQSRFLPTNHFEYDLSNCYCYKNRANRKSFTIVLWTNAIQWLSFIATPDLIMHANKIKYI